MIRAMTASHLHSCNAALKRFDLIFQAKSKVKWLGIVCDDGKSLKLSSVRFAITDMCEVVNRAKHVATLAVEAAISQRQSPRCSWPEDVVNAGVSCVASRHQRCACRRTNRLHVKRL